MRFCLVDQVLERSADRLTAVKTVTSGEEYLADHFPGFAVLPGVMMLEAMAQAGRLLVGGGDDPTVVPLVIREVRNVRYGNMVRPGQSLRVEVTLKGQTEAGYELSGRGTVDGDVAVQGRFTLSSPEAR